MKQCGVYDTREYTLPEAPHSMMLTHFFTNHIALINDRLQGVGNFFLGDSAKRKGKNKT